MDSIQYARTKGLLDNIPIENMNMTDVIDIEDTVQMCLYTEDGKLISNIDAISYPVPFYQLFLSYPETIIAGDVFYLQKYELEHHHENVLDIGISYQKLIFDGGLF